MWIQFSCAFMRQLESLPKHDRPDRVDNYGIFALSHNTSMRAYTFLGNLSMFRHLMEIREEHYGSCLTH